MQGGQAAAAAAPAAASVAPQAAAASSSSFTSVAPGKQFITGVCSSDADCQSACCGFNSGKCAGPVIAQERDGGCGFGDAQPNDTAAKALTQNVKPAVAVQPADSLLVRATPNSAGSGQGKQFITGVCASDADCASACCGFKSGKCAGAVVAQERDGGCGFGDAQPNNNAVKAITFKVKPVVALQPADSAETTDDFNTVDLGLKVKPVVALQPADSAETVDDFNTVDLGLKVKPVVALQPAASAETVYDSETVDLGLKVRPVVALQPADSAETTDDFNTVDLGLKVKPVVALQPADSAETVDDFNTVDLGSKVRSVVAIRPTETVKDSNTVDLGLEVKPPVALQPVASITVPTPP
jgi:hypothetical protein